MYFGDNDLSLAQFRPGGIDSKNRSERFTDNKKLTLSFLSSFRLPYLRGVVHTQTADVELYTHPPTLANVERGNPQNYDAFKKHIQFFAIALPTLIPCQHYLAS